MTELREMLGIGDAELAGAVTSVTQAARAQQSDEERFEEMMEERLRDNGWSPKDVFEGMASIRSKDIYNAPSAKVTVNGVVQEEPAPYQAQHQAPKYAA